MLKRMLKALWEGLYGKKRYEKEQKNENKKVTLHHMKKNAKGDKPFSLNAHVREGVEE